LANIPSSMMYHQSFFGSKLNVGETSFQSNSGAAFFVAFRLKTGKSNSLMTYGMTNTAT
jgi:hypothetical protein